MAWRRSGDKPLSEPMMVRLPMHICITRPQWVNALHNCIHYRFIFVEFNYSGNEDSLLLAAWVTEAPFFNIFFSNRYKSDSLNHIHLWQMFSELICGVWISCWNPTEYTKEMERPHSNTDKSQILICAANHTLCNSIDDVLMSQITQCGLMMQYEVIELGQHDSGNGVVA